MLCLCCPDFFRGAIGCCGFYCCCGAPITEQELKKRKEEEEEKAKKEGPKTKTYYQKARLACFDFMKQLLDRPQPAHSYAVDKIYWDGDGNLRQGGSTRDRDGEILMLLEADQLHTDDPEKIWVVVPSRFIREWLLFAQMKLTNDHPSPIDIGSLLKADPSCAAGYRPLKTLRPPEKVVSKNSSDYAKVEYSMTPGHYRLITIEAWRRLVVLYGIREPGVVIAVKGNTEESPYTDMSRWRVFPDAMQHIDPNALPDAIVKTEEEKAKEITKKQKMFASLGVGL